MGLGRYPGAVGAFLNSAVEGAGKYQNLEKGRLDNAYMENALVNPAIRQNTADSDAFGHATDSARRQNPGMQYSDAKAYTPLRDVFAEKMQAMMGKARGMFGGHATAAPSAQGPAAPTVNPQSAPSPAQAAPGPESSAPGNGGQLGVGSSQVAEPWDASQYGGQMANGGAVGRPTGINPTTGIKPRKPKQLKPRNTEANPGMPGGTDQGGPTFADGGDVQGDLPDVNVTASRGGKAPGGTEPINLNGYQINASSDPAIRAKGQQALKDIDARDAAARGRKAQGKVVTNDQLKYAGQTKFNPEPGSYADGGTPDPLAPADQYEQASLGDVAGALGNGLSRASQDVTQAGLDTGLGVGKKILGAGREAVNAALTKGPVRFVKKVRPSGAESESSAALPGMADNYQKQNGFESGMGQFGPAPAAQGPGPAGDSPEPAASPVPGRKAAGGGGAPATGPTHLPAQTDFSQLQLDHSQVPSVNSDEWSQMKGDAVRQMVARGMPLSQAQITADDQLSDYQHKQFMQLVQQGIALDAAGHKQGAMAALKAAYQYMPNGHDVQFGLDPKSGNIVGVTMDEKTGQPSGTHMLDQKNLNGLLATYQDPNNFRAELKDYQGMDLQRRTFNEVTKPLAGAQAGYYGAHAQYMRDANPTRLAMIQARAAAGGNRLPVQSQKFYAGQFNRSIPDPNDQAEALGLAEQLEGQYGNSPQSQGKIAALVQRIYSAPPEQRSALMGHLGLSSSMGGMGMGDRDMYDPAMGGGYGIPPR